MICLLCLNNREDCINLFRGEGIEKKIADIVSKHFWLQAQEEDEMASTICTICWVKLEAFHIFYLAVEQAHKSLGALSCNQLKTDSENDIQKYEPLPVMVCLKSENDDDADLALPSDDPIECTNRTTRRLTRQSVKTQLIESATADIKIKIENEEDTLLVPFGSHVQGSSASDDNSDEFHLSSGEEEDGTEDESEADEREQKKSPKTTAPNLSTKKRVRPRQSVRKPKDENTKKFIEENENLIAQNMKLQCDICSVPLENFRVLRTHYRTEHNKRGYAVCCQRKFADRTNLADHIRRHLDPDCFKCEDCGKVTASRRCLIVHRNHKHLSENYYTIPCDQCPKKFPTLSSLKAHQLCHIPEDAKTFKCEECGKCFPTKYRLKVHVDNVHNFANAQICDICGRHFKSKKVLEDHLQVHDATKKSDESHQCTICGSVLKSKYNLTKHIKAHHPPQGVNLEVTCHICGKISPNKGARRNHINYVHRTPRNYKCNICEKAFKKNYQLTEHMTTHTGGALYNCPHCPKTFNSISNMHAHRKRVHRKEWEENRANRIIRPCAVPVQKSIGNSALNYNL